MPRLIYAALLGLGLIWGGSFYFIKMLLHDFGPWSIAFLRSGFGLLVVLVIMTVFKKPFGFRAIPWLAMFIMALINTAVPWTLIGFSEQRLTSSLASILNATTPVWTIVVGIAFFGNKSNRMQWIGLATATIGVVILLGIRPGTLLSFDGIGLIGMLCATFSYAVGSQLSKRLSLRGLTMYQITYGTLLSSTVTSGIFAFSTESITWPHLTSMDNVPMILGLGMFGSGFAYILFYYMVEKGSAEFASMVTYLVPCTALIWGSTLLGEPIKWNMLVGLVIILGGVFLASRKPRSGNALRPQEARSS
ncbi:drug/metabolite transporter (DMT)-like permease [Paenibacillus taihuensis]|uniref:Drug/metabolite transporter (DMT)-like permease n=1 Tax=Paenibacillus taihuensis TaxID=1156355 RepID=A0A3D9SB32_9BACL|nr:DMT family transporter [Paenibacillus taihuensis]REE86422.1 drug/metabolite transporter (DMT)-like permease [Paenibacillus taihuensis]